MTKLRKLKGFEEAISKNSRKYTDTLSIDEKGKKLVVGYQMLDKSIIDIDKISDVNVVVDEVNLVNEFDKFDNYEDEIPKELWDIICNAVKNNDKSVIQDLVRTTVRLVRKECSIAVTTQIKEIIRLEKSDDK